MNSGQIVFLRLLLGHEEYLPTGFYAGGMDISNKTLHRVVHRINEILVPYSGVVEGRPRTRVGPEINGEKRGGLMDLTHMVEPMDSSTLSRSWNQLSRRMDIALNLLLYSGETTSLSGLTYKHYVSKGSIAGDSRAFVPFARKHGLRIIQGHGGASVGRTGSYLRKALVELLLYVLDNNINANARDNPAAVGMFGSETLMTILDIFTEEDLSFTEGLTRYVEMPTDYRPDGQEYMEFPVNLLMMIYRVRNGFLIEPVLESNYRKQEKDPPDVIALELTSRLSGSYRYIPSVSRTSHIHNILAATHLGNFLIQKKLPEGESRKTTVTSGGDFIDASSVTTGINLRMESAFCMNTTSHITLTLSRAASSIPARNPVIDILLENYRGIINTCQIMCRILVEKFKLPEVSFDEICYLMLYIQSELLVSEEGMDIILTSNMSNSITSILKHKLSQDYPRWTVVNNDYNHFLEMFRKQYDLILSAVLLGSRGHVTSYALISPLLNEGDCSVISDLLKSCHHREDLYLRELTRTRNGLYDTKCVVGVRNRRPMETPVIEFLKVTVLKEVEFVYVRSRVSISRCQFAMDLLQKKLNRVIIDTSNWDSMLLTSEMAYLMDNCPDWAMTEFIQDVIMEGR